jgi:hypothetical protein
MEERVIISAKTTRHRGKAFDYARNILAGIGVLSVVALLLIVGLSWIQKGLGVKTVFKAVANEDGSAKATIYQIDVGRDGSNTNLCRSFQRESGRVRTWRRCAHLFAFRRGRAGHFSGLENQSTASRNVSPWRGD